MSSLSLQEQVTLVVAGQVLSLLISLTSTLSTLLANASISLPTTQSCLCYFLLAVVFKYIPLWKAYWRPFPDHPPSENEDYVVENRGWWKYAALAFLDVEANFFVVSAFHLTSITSVVLIDQWSIPVVMIGSKMLGIAAYSKGHATGVLVCVSGLLLLLWTDLVHGADTHTAAHNPLLGDFLAFVGATCYGSSNLLQETLLDGASMQRVLGNLGVAGFLISLVQGAILEWGAIIQITWTGPLLLYFILFPITLFLFYSLVPHVLSNGGATLLNISLLSSDFYVALIRVFLLDGSMNMTNIVWFSISLLLVSIGICLYSLSGDAKRHNRSMERQYHQVALSPTGSLVDVEMFEDDPA